MRGRLADFSWCSLLILLLIALGCSEGSEGNGADEDVRIQALQSLVEYSEERDICSIREPLRRVLYGDLHVHTGFSFDAYSYGNHLSPEDAYAFARGSSVGLAPLDGGVATRSATLDRPLDFLAVTDHGEFLGEIHQCSTMGSYGYDSEPCLRYRDPEGNGAFQFGTPLSGDDPVRDPLICGEDLEECHNSSALRWAEMVQAAEEAYDRSSDCSFTTFVSYEYTNTHKVSNLHRNVIFRNAVVPEKPISYFEAPFPDLLWTGLDEACNEGLDGCDVLVIPHNSNLSNGRLFSADFREAESAEARRARLKLRARMEPLVEIFQAKGDSECRNGFELEDAEEDPLCTFEKLRPEPLEDCGDEVGTGGMRLWGCLHRLDFVRYVLKEGFRQEREYQVNPYRFGFVGATDTHNGTPGLVASEEFPGHVGTADDTAEKRLGPGTITHEGIVSNPGGITAVWSVENSRDAIFEAWRRREVYATSGPRIPVRFFGGWDFSEELCADSQLLVEQGYQAGVPMGGFLPSRESEAPVFLVHAHMDEGTAEQPGVPLQRLQIVKGWIDAAGKTYEKVYDVAGKIENGASLDEKTCLPEGGNYESLCARWRDPDFNPEQSAFYYARVLQNPTCRWSAYQCAEFSVDSRPVGCGTVVPDTVQERAYTSPIWYEPEFKTP